MPPTETAALDENTDADAIKARNKNSLAMSYLLSAFKAEADISLAHETMTDDWPGGKANKVVTKLMEMCKPKDTITEVTYSDTLTIKREYAVILHRVLPCKFKEDEL